MLNASADVSKLNASLPAEFFEKRAVMQQDCSAVASSGRNLALALVDYQADCFRVTNGGANCSLKQALGEPWDHLLDTPFQWSGIGLQSCFSAANSNAAGVFGDYNMNSSYKCAFCTLQTTTSDSYSSGSNDSFKCATPAMIRLSVCPSEAWWPHATQAALDTLK